jgi:hypothetical protein
LRDSLTLRSSGGFVIPERLSKPMRASDLDWWAIGTIERELVAMRAYRLFTSETFGGENQTKYSGEEGWKGKRIRYLGNVANGQNSETEAHEYAASDERPNLPRSEVLNLTAVPV